MLNLTHNNVYSIEASQNHHRILMYKIIKTNDMKMYLLMVGFDYEGYNGDVRVFKNREAAEKAAEANEYKDYDYVFIDEVEVED
jgi:hypothetical protein